MTTSYRPEIDGLRAIAIVPVVLFHFDFAAVSGGFVGVDIFFVISGFLIGGILWNELQDTGRISLGRFFMRRIRRLAPAYYVMVFSVFIAGWFILLPFEFREFGKEILAATVYLSNVYFWMGAGYFEALAGERTLLHTWSLAVEEQFYLVFPILLILLARARRLIPWVLIGLGIVSLVACIAVTATSQATAFYLFPFRAWELLAGVMLAIIGRERNFNWQIHAALSWVGLALLLGAIVLIEKGDGFPGAWALLPVIGTVLMIANGQHRNLINRMLCSWPFLFFGAISYSLYLWHWPIAVLARYYFDSEIGTQLAVVLIIVSVLLAWASLHLVENPVRKNRLPTLGLLAGYGIASMAALAIGAAVYLKDGIIDRFDSAFHPMIHATRGFHQDWSRCTTPADGPFSGVEVCPIGPDGPPKVLIWGDSHARAFKEGLERAAFESDTPALLIWRGGCPPLVGMDKFETASTRFENESCTLHNNRIASAIGALPSSYETVLLIGRWAYYAEGKGVGADAHNLVEIARNDAATFEADTAPDIFKGALLQTTGVIEQAGLTPMVMRQPPEIFDFSVRAAARALAYGQTTVEGLAEAEGQTPIGPVLARNATVDRVLQAFDGRVIDTWQRICAQDACRAMQGEEVYYFDNNHLTNTGAIAIRDSYAPVFAPTEQGVD